MLNFGYLLTRDVVITAARRLQTTLAVAASKRENSASTKGFLPDDYSCSTQWTGFLQSQVEEYNLNNTKASELLIAAKDHAVKGGKFYELDIDTLAVAIGSGFYDENELDMFEKQVLPVFRHGPRASRWLASSPAIITRSYTDHCYYSRLKNLVGNKEQFGMFPDHISYSSLLNTLISQGNAEDAAFFGAEWMLQEELSISNLANALSLFACWQRGVELGKFELNLTVPGEDAEDEQMIRVNFLLNPYNDLHFDLTSEHHRIGKSLFVLGKLFGNTNCAILGTALFENYHDTIGLIKSSNNELSVEALDKLEQLLGLAETREDAEARWKPTMEQHIDRALIERKITNDDRSKLVDELKAVRESLEKSGRLVKDSGFVSSQLADLVKTAAGTECKRDIAIREAQLSKEWPELRKKLLEEQAFEAGRLAAISETRKSLLEMRENMETLSYFQRRDEIGVRQELGEKAAKQAEEDAVRRRKDRKDRRWKKPEVKREEAHANIGLYPITGV